jgi:hypothetical protein
MEYLAMKRHKNFFPKRMIASSLLAIVGSSTVHAHCVASHPHHCLDQPSRPSSPPANEHVIVEPDIRIVPSYGSSAYKYCRRDSSGDNLLVRFKNTGNAKSTGGPNVRVYFNVTNNPRVRVSHRLPSVNSGESVDLSFLIPNGCFNHDCSFSIRWGRKSVNGFCLG